MAYHKLAAVNSCTSRKRVVSTKATTEDVLEAELRLAGIVLSCAPKSEETWAHRSFFKPFYFMFVYDFTLN